MNILKQLLANLHKPGGFGRNMAVLTSGTAIAQLIIVLTAPIITRLYAPSEFGILAVYSAMIGIGGVLATLQYHQAIPLPKERNTMAAVFILSLASIIVVGSLATAALWGSGRKLLAAISADALIPYMWLVPLGLVGIALYETTSSYAIRQKAFGRIAATRLGQSVAQSGTQIASGLAGFGPAGLLVGQFLGQVVGSTSLAALAWRRDKGVFRQVRLKDVIAAASRYRRFPKFGTWAALLNTLSLQGPILLLSYFFGGTVTGLFALTQQVLLMPVALLSKSASQAFTAAAVDANREDRIAEEALSLFGRMIRLGAPMAVAVLLIAPEVFTTMFGEAWRASGLYAQWLSAWLLFTFLTLPLSPLVAILERQAAGALFQLILLVGRVGAIVIGGIAEDPMLAIILFAIVGAVLRSAFLLWLLHIAGTDLRDVISHTRKALLFATLVNLAPATSKLAGFSDIVTVVVAFCSGTITLAWLLRRASTQSRR